MAEEPKTGNDPLTEGVSLFCYYQANRLTVISLLKKAEMLLMANVGPRQGEALQPQPNPQFST